MSIITIKDEERLQNLEARLAELKGDYAHAERALNKEHKEEYMIQMKELQLLIEEVELEIRDLVGMSY